MMKKLFFLALLTVLLFGCVSTKTDTGMTTDTDMKDDSMTDTEMKAPAEVTRRAIPAFVANKAKKAPVIDGTIGDGEWSDGVKNSLAYNQLNNMDLRPPKDQNDISGDWSVVFVGKTLYGMVKRTDDITFLNAENVWENDCVEVFLDQSDKFIQFRTLIGEDFAGADFAGAQQAVWSEDGSVLEFSVDMPVDDLDGTSCGFALALADNDGEGRDYQLYCINGQNDSWQGVNMGTLAFGDPAASAADANVVIPFKANQTNKDVVVDGMYSDDEYKDAVKYQLCYNQLNTSDERMNRDYNDLYSDWGVVCKGNMLYGYVYRQDDKTVTNKGDVWENDTVEVFLQVGDDNFLQIRSVVGQPFDSKKYNAKSAWSADGSIFEFSFEFKVPAVDLKIIGFNIAIADNDGKDTRESQLYPIYGYNDGWQGKNFAELEFVKK
jgi:hypothetical protein